MWNIMGWFPNPWHVVSYYFYGSILRDCARFVCTLLNLLRTIMFIFLPLPYATFLSQKTCIHIIYIYDVYIYIPTVIWQISTMCCPFSWYFLVPPCNMPSPLHGVGPRLRSEVRRLEERMAEKEAEHKARGGNYGLLWLHHEKKWKWRLWAFKMHETWSFKMFVTVFPTNVILFSCV